MARHLTEEEIKNKKEREAKKLLDYIADLSFNFGLPKVEFLDPRLKDEMKDIFHRAMEDIEEKIREAYNFHKEEKEIDEVDDEHFINVCEWF